MLRRILGRLPNRGTPSDDEIAREIQDHLALEAESLGNSMQTKRDDASGGARRRFGNATNAQEAVRDVWHWSWLDDLSQDGRHGARALLRSPAYSARIIVTLAIG